MKFIKIIIQCIYLAAICFALLLTIGCSREEPNSVFLGVWQATIAEDGKTSLVELDLQADKSNVKGTMKIVGGTDESAPMGQIWTIMNPEIDGNTLKFILPITGQIDEESVTFKLEILKDQLSGSLQEQGGESLPVVFNKQK